MADYTIILTATEVKSLESICVDIDEIKVSAERMRFEKKSRYKSY